MTTKVHTDFPCEYILNALPVHLLKLNSQYSVIHVKHWTAPSAEVYHPLCCVCVSVVHDSSLCSSPASSRSSLHWVSLAWLATLIRRQPC